MDKPVFSIICPCYNQIDFLEDAVHSVLSQGFNRWELIILNDGSTDGSDRLADELARKDLRIRVIHQSNQGLSSARNIGLAVAKGDFIGFLDSDDIYLAGAFQAVFSQISKSNADLIIGGYSYFKGKDFFHTHQFTVSKLSPEFLLRTNQAPPIAHFLKHSVAKSIGDFDTSLKSCEDWEYWTRVAKKGFKIITIPEVIAGYRYVPNSMSRQPKVMYQALSEVNRRAHCNDSQLSENSTEIAHHSADISEIQKNHLIRCLGVLIHQGKANEASAWYQEEVVKWNWVLEDKDWLGLSSPLSWRYFFDQDEIKTIFQKLLPELRIFFYELGYSPSKTSKLISEILRPQRYRLNHIRYGKLLGALINRIFK
ncbi:glycosyltransferase [Algoriphagus sp. AK58]|uniref:glycosyltransferase family 2 protein n=1 Tax=Algoriphagus sp. AK58 TaxID=1406877 RepID=UPI00164FE74E|nr:glycosyltransferase [Algoriphagus sp. AK58]